MVSLGKVDHQAEQIRSNEGDPPQGNQGIIVAASGLRSLQRTGLRRVLPPYERHQQKIIELYPLVRGDAGQQRSQNRRNLLRDLQANPGDREIVPSMSM